VIAALQIHHPSDHADGATLDRQGRTRRPGMQENRGSVRGSVRGSEITSWLFLKARVAAEMADVKGITNRRDGDP